MTRAENEALSRRALRAFQEAVRLARAEHAKKGRPFYVLENGRVVDVFRRSKQKRTTAR